MTLVSAEQLKRAAPLADDKIAAAVVIPPEELAKDDDQPTLLQ